MSRPSESSTSRVLQPAVGAAEADVRQKLGVRRCKQREGTVEIGAGAEIESALVLAEMILRPADRIGPRHDGDGAFDAALGLGLGQHRHQRVDGDDARQFAGMQGGLEIGGRSRLVRALEAEDREFVSDSLAVAGDALDRLLHEVSPMERPDMHVCGRTVEWSSRAALWAQAFTRPAVAAALRGGQAPATAPQQ